MTTERVHLAGEDEDDDLYSGFEVNDEFQSYEQEAAFQHAVKTSQGKRPPPTGKIPFGHARLGTGQRGGPSSMGRPVTGAVAGDGARPMTAVRGAGFTSAAKNRGVMDSGNAGPAPPLETKGEDTPDEKLKLLEKKVNQLVEESCLASHRGEHSLALEKAKEAGRKERLLMRQRETAGGGEQTNLDLTYSILFNLANQYAANEMYGEALNTYNVIVKNKMFSNAGRLKVNMGNIHFKQKDYAKAVKYYRMALDQVPNTHKQMRFRIMQNIATAFIKQGQYGDAVTSLEHIMAENPSITTGFNLIICYYAMNDKEKMKLAFQKLLLADIKQEDEEKYTTHSDDKQHNSILSVIKNDSLRQYERERKSEAERCIKNAAKLISPVIDASFAQGYDWCIEQVRTSNYVDLSHDLEIDKAIMYLKKKDFQRAAESLKSFEKKDNTKVASTAATNLSFLYFLEKDMNQADKYAELAMQVDRYNPSALVNKGNVLFAKNEYEKALQFYKEAVTIESSCVEGLFNLGLCYKRIGRLDDAFDSFIKLHAILKSNAEVIYHLADLVEQQGDETQAMEWYMQLISLVPTDPSILARLGEIHDATGDKPAAFQHYYDSYRYFPSNIEIIEWLGAYYIESQLWEKAISYFERAALIQPNQVKWHLMIASCHRKSGNYPQALETYKYIHKKFPDNIECLKFLVRVCTDLGLKEAQDYANKLKKAEKAKELKDQRATSGTRRMGSGVGGSRNNSAGSDRLGSGSGGDSRKSSALGARSSAGRVRHQISLDGVDNKPYQVSNPQSIDDSYSDPLGPQVERPKTAAKRREEPVDEFADEELDDDLLPD